MVGDQLERMIVEAQNNPAMLMRLAASPLDPKQIVAKLKDLGVRTMAVGAVPPPAGVGYALAAPTVAQPGQPVPPPQQGIGHLLLGG